jgi:two-component system phosphate regulon sensor histidine kinase PhoR
MLVLRPDLLGTSPKGRAVLAGAAALLATTALLHGALPATTFSQNWLDGLRLASAILLIPGCLTVEARWPRRALVASIVVLGPAELGFLGRSGFVDGFLRLLGGCGMGLSLWLAARRSLATRIASAAGLLLVVTVLLLSGVLSAVITTNVSRETLDRAADRAGIEAAVIEGTAKDAVARADLVDEILRRSAPLDEDAIRRSLDDLESEHEQLHFLAVLDSAGTVVAATGPGPGLLLGLARTPTLQEALARRLASAGGVEAVGSALVVLGAARVVISHPTGPGIEGIVVAGSLLDLAYLQERIRDGRGTNLSLVTENRLLATTFAEGERPTEPTRLLDGPAGTTVVHGAFVSGETAKRQGTFGGDEVFVAVSPISTGATGGPGVAVAVTGDSSSIEKARASLFRTLFLAALAAAALALALASVTGARLGGPLRRLASAADRISRGDLSVRSGLRSPDEIGLLGSSFDDMAGSIERMTAELREAAAHLEAVVNSMTDGLVAADPVGRVAMMNPAAEAMLGVRASGESGKPVAAVVRARDRSGAALAEHFGAPLIETWSTVGVLETPGGPLPVALSGAPVRSELGDVLGAVYVLRDMRRELEVEEAKTEFLSNVSHELRTPLTPIKGYAEMLLRHQQVPAERRLAPEKVRDFLEGILQCSERLERTVDILVNFAAIEAGRLVLSSESLDVGSMVHEICQRWRPRSDRHRIEESIVGTPRVVADRRLLERCVDELVDNAVKYSPEGGTVVVKAQLVGAEDEPAVEISVSDDGIGIAPADFERVFGEFSQVDGSATRRYGGLGLGLPFVQRVVSAHGGSLEANSEPGVGSTFVIRIPIQASGQVPRG